MDSDGSPVSPRMSSCAKTSPIRVLVLKPRARESSSTSSRMTKRLADFMNGDAATDGVWVSKG